VGIYQDNGSIYPGSLVADAGTVDTSSIGLKEITGLSISLSANTLYWFVLVTNVAPSLVVTPSGGGWQPLGFDTTTLNVTGGAFWKVSFTYATLPATFPGGGAAQTSTATPKIAIYF
jgi:hypothetical protein